MLILQIFLTDVGPSIVRQYVRQLQNNYFRASKVVLVRLDFSIARIKTMVAMQIAIATEFMPQHYLQYLFLVASDVTWHHLIQ